MVWLFFEALLLCCLAYEWTYKVGAKNYIFDLEDAQNASPAPAFHAKQQNPVVKQPTQQAKQPIVSQGENVKISKNIQTNKLPVNRVSAGYKPKGMINKGGRPEIEISPEMKMQIQNDLQNGLSVRKVVDKYGVSKYQVKKLKSG